MSRAPQHYLGIDFGTSHTYVCLGSTNPVNTHPIHFGRQPSIATAVLWEYSAVKSSHKFLVAVGNQAEEEWQAATDEERKHYCLELNFKPDIVDRESARKAASAFLSKVYDHLCDSGKLPGGTPPKDFPVAIGFPACVPREYEQCLKDLASKAGFSAATMVEEPVAALICQVYQGHLAPHQARGGVLVIDFGGGTCDIAFLVRGKIVGTWGDSTLGGRLFDDLFYQWFVDQNPGADEKLKDCGHEVFVHWVKCREMKERFSDTMNRPLDERRRKEFTFTDMLGHGTLQGATWDEFLDRAKRYCPSPDMVGVLTGHGSDLQENRSPGLIGSFERFLIEGMKSNGIRKEEIDWVVLTGGSSNWCFVRDCVREVLKLPAAHILQSPDPTATIGEGAALLCPLKIQWKDGREKLNCERSDIAQQISAKANTILEQGAGQLANELAREFVNEHLEALVDEFPKKEESWCIRDLEEAIGTRAANFDNTVKQRIKEHGEKWDAKIREAGCDILSTWFQEVGVPEELEEALSAGAVDTTVHVKPPSVNDPYEWCVRVAVTVVVAIISANILGGAGLALLMAGPRGLVVGAVVGAVAALAGLWLGRKAVRGQTNLIAIPKWARPVVLPRLETMEKDLIKAFGKELKPAIQQQRDAVSSSIDRTIDEVASALDWLIELQSNTELP